MAFADSSGFVRCRCGRRHWGRFGAAGLLLTRPGTDEVFLQLRSPWVHTPNTWGTPGGARDSHETSVEAALREAHEENAIEPAQVRVVEVLRTLDHEVWSYDLVLGVLLSGEPSLVTDESSDAGWFRPDEVPGLDLHPGLRQAWPATQEALTRLRESVAA